MVHIGSFKTFCLFDVPLRCHSFLLSTLSKSLILSFVVKFRSGVVDCFIKSFFVVGYGYTYDLSVVSMTSSRRPSSL